MFVFSSQCLPYCHVILVWEKMYFDKGEGEKMTADIKWKVIVTRLLYFGKHITLPLNLLNHLGNGSENHCLMVQLLLLKIHFNMENWPCV